MESLVNVLLEVEERRAAGEDEGQEMVERMRDADTARISEFESVAQECYAVREMDAPGNS